MSETDRATVDAAIAAVEEQFGIMFTRVRASMRERAARVHPSLQPAGYKILSILVFRGPENATILAEQLMVDKSVVSRQVRMLEDLGLIEREVDAADRRAHVLAATALGRERIEAIRHEDQHLLYERLRDWPLTEVSDLAELLMKLNRDLLL